MSDTRQPTMRDALRDMLRELRVAQRAETRARAEHEEAKAAFQKSGAELDNPYASTAIRVVLPSEAVLQRAMQRTAFLKQNIAETLVGNAELFNVLWNIFGPKED